MRMNRKRIEKALEEALSDVRDSRVREAMAYALLAGGKRIRPLFLFAVSTGYGVPEEEGMALACALEMIHTYSLIHDDLPAMDDDDFRRGRLACHKQFDEATAILAGDGLLTEAFRLAVKAPVSANRLLTCVQVLAAMAGASGMVYGQCLDLAEDDSYDWEMVKNVHRYKTGCLLAAPFMIGALLGGQREECVQKWKEVGMNIGLAFQIQDDLLDETGSVEKLGKSSSDQRNNKVTSVSLLGVQEAEKRMREYYAESRRLICEMPSFDAEPLFELLEMIQNRDR